MPLAAEIILGIFTNMRSLKIIFFSLLFQMPLFGKTQIMKLDFDSVYLICKYNDLKKRIKKDESKQDAEIKMAVIDSLKKIRHDTILISHQLIYDYHGEANDLVKANKVSFFDQRTNKMVLHIEKTKEGKKGQVLFYLYRDADTKKELYELIIKSWQEF